MPRCIRTPRFWLAALAVGCIAGAAGAQQQNRPPKIDTQKLVHNLMLGRYTMPVTCTLSDGSLVEREESLVFRTSHDTAGFPTIRATFFGIDAPAAARCYNGAYPRLQDRRGVLYLSFEAHYRPDLGMHDLRQILKREGRLEFRVSSGRLLLREIRPDPDGEATRLDFADRDATFVVKSVRPQSDADKVISRRATDTHEGARAPRRFEIQIDGREDLSLTGFYIEDLSRAAQSGR
jgi:hypothetical protein